MPQYPTDTALKDALAGPNPQIRPQLLFDWYRDGSFSAPPGSANMSDLSRLVVEADLEMSSIVSDLPTAVNAVLGSSSGQLTLTLAGKRNAEEYAALQLFSQYFVANNPLAGFRKEGTPVKYSRIVKTSAGFTTVRQFTGWIQEITELNETTGEVKLVCSDVYDLKGSLVTMPRWAIGPSAEQAYPAVGSQFSRMHPIDTSWVYALLAQQGGRTMGVSPPTSTDCAVLWNCNGSFIPSIGTFADTAMQQHWISYESAFGAWVPGLYGLCPQLATSNNNANLSKSICRTQIQKGVPSNGVATDVPQWSEFSFWAYSDGTGDTSTTVITDIRMYLDSTTTPTPIDKGRVFVESNRSGRTRLWIKEATSLGNIWSWLYDTSQAIGWHYYSWIIAWTYNGITATLHVDDVLVTLTGTSSPGAGLGFRYSAYLAGDEIGNQASITARNSIQHVMIRHGKTAITYNANQKLPVMREGAPMVNLDQSTSQLVFLPDTINRPVWDVFKDVVNAELGVLYVDEFGVLQLRKRENVWNIENINTANAEVLSRDKLAGLQIAPSRTLYRNAISMQTRFTQAIRGIVWQASDAKQFYAPDSSPYQQFFTLDTSVISAQPGFNSISATPDTVNGVDLTRVTVAAVRADNVTLDALTYPWAADTQVQDDQRSIKILWSGQSAGVPLYIGSYLSANQPAYFVPGTKYDTIKNAKFLYVNQTEITATANYQLLEIPASDWMQSQDATDVLSTNLLRDLAKPAPVLSPVRLPADPRRQLLDVVTITGGPTMLGSIYAQVVGIRRIDSQTDAHDELTLRIVNTPASALWDNATLGWDVGTWSN